MKNLNLWIALVIGLVAGFFIKGLLNEDATNFTNRTLPEKSIIAILNNENSRKIIGNYFNQLSSHKPKKVTLKEAIGLTDSLYKFEINGKVSRKLDDIIYPSYVFDIYDVVGSFFNNGLDDMQMRIYPVRKPNTDTLSLMVMLEKKGVLLIDNDINKSTAFEYVGVCPQNCPTNDLKNTSQWNEIYNRALNRQLNW